MKYSMTAAATFLLASSPLAHSAEDNLDEIIQIVMTEADNVLTKTPVPKKDTPPKEVPQAVPDVQDPFLLKLNSAVAQALGDPDGISGVEKEWEMIIHEQLSGACHFIHEEWDDLSVDQQQEAFRIAGFLDRLLPISWGAYGLFILLVIIAKLPSRSPKTKSQPLASSTEAKLPSRREKFLEILWATFPIPRFDEVFRKMDESLRELRYPLLLHVVGWAGFVPVLCAVGAIVSAPNEEKVETLLSALRDDEEMAKLVVDLEHREGIAGAFQVIRTRVPDRTIQPSDGVTEQFLGKK